MKKKILSGVFALGLLATAGFGVNRSVDSDANLSDLALRNVEALAQSENDLCPNGCWTNGNGCYCYGWYPDYKEASW